MGTVSISGRMCVEMNARDVKTVAAHRRDSLMAVSMILTSNDCHYEETVCKSNTRQAITLCYRGVPVTRCSSIQRMCVGATIGPVDQNGCSGEVSQSQALTSRLHQPR